MTHFNFFEHWLVDSNLPFFLASYLYSKKDFVLISLVYIALPLVSMRYHICFSPEHIKEDRNYNYYGLCTVGNMSVEGMSVMFVDIFFANAAFIYSFMLVIPIRKTNTVPFRYLIATICMTIILLTGVYVGFFPDTEHPTQPVGEMAKLIGSERMKALKRRHMLGRVVDMMIVMSKLNKATYISIVMFIFFISTYLAFLLLFIIDTTSENKEKVHKMSNRQYIKFLCKELVHYYDERFEIKFLVVAGVAAGLAIFIWVVLERIYPNIYKSSHGIWHLLDGVASIAIPLGIKVKNNFYI